MCVCGEGLQAVVHGICSVLFFAMLFCRFPKNKGVAGYVASTGETLNITDAYHDERFNRYIHNFEISFKKLLLALKVVRTVARASRLFTQFFTVLARLRRETRDLTIRQRQRP